MDDPTGLPVELPIPADEGSPVQPVADIAQGLSPKFSGRCNRLVPRNERVFR
jgi:hypothetical protein